MNIFRGEGDFILFYFLNIFSSFLSFQGGDFICLFFIFFLYFLNIF